MNNSDVVIIGAGPAGLACAASMGARGAERHRVGKDGGLNPYKRIFDCLQGEQARRQLSRQSCSIVSPKSATKDR